MRKIRVLLAFVQVALVAALAFVLRSESWPLGVRGEWEWLRLARGPAAPDVAIAAVAVLAYAGYAALVLRSLTRKASTGREVLAVTTLLIAATALQCVVPSGAPEGYGLAKWSLVLHSPASTGYYTVAEREIRDPWRFLSAYPEWIQMQDALHVGTHPPGLFLIEHALLHALARRPALARRVVDLMPGTVETGFRVIDSYDPLHPLPMADRATLGLTGALTLLACAATVVPLYVLARASLPPPSAWSTAVLWPLLPSAILFQPVADTAFPFLSVTAIALAAHAIRASGGLARALAACSGLVLALGMSFTLVFLPVGLIAGILLLSASDLRPRRRLILLLATGAGFLAPTLLCWWATGTDPFVIWWWNARNHARFYQEYPRSYLAWVLVNPVELAVALGVPATVWAIVGFVSSYGSRKVSPLSPSPTQPSPTRGEGLNLTPSPLVGEGRGGGISARGQGFPCLVARRVPRAAIATLAVLVVLTLSGRNLSEVARLWLPFMPMLLLASGHGLSRLGAGGGSLAAALVTTGAETLVLQATIQVVYPV